MRFSQGSKQQIFTYAVVLYTSAFGLLLFGAHTYVLSMDRLWRGVSSGWQRTPLLVSDAPFQKKIDNY
ncbi:hypothetical protein [Paenibacillus taiwanensis]|uniref:hypothetical protein n=1 Tax=Paenibacillus taiwanensis TaxID=401638 RepID=UPI0004002B18|nr:hypothetical protein [Paenibacillus taiwanensis]